MTVTAWLLLALIVVLLALIPAFWSSAPPEVAGRGHRGRHRPDDDPTVRLDDPAGRPLL